MYNTSRICPNYLKGKSKINIHLYLIDCSLLNIQWQIFHAYSEGQEQYLKSTQKQLIFLYPLGS